MSTAAPEAAPEAGHAGGDVYKQTAATLLRALRERRCRAAKMTQTLAPCPKQEEVVLGDKPVGSGIVKQAESVEAPRLFVVANRLPLTLSRLEDGSYKSRMSSGGLVRSRRFFLLPSADLGIHVLPPYLCGASVEVLPQYYIAEGMIGEGGELLT